MILEGAMCSLPTSMHVARHTLPLYVVGVFSAAACSFDTSAPQLARMKRGAILINVGRARIVDHVALGEAAASDHRNLEEREVALVDRPRDRLGT